MLHLKDAFQASSYFIYKYIVETSLLLHASTFDILSVSFPSKMMYVYIASPIEKNCSLPQKVSCQKSAQEDKS